MTIQEYRRILAERNALQNLLDRLPSSRVIAGGRCNVGAWSSESGRWTKSSLHGRVC